MINVIIAVAVASAVFGMMRQTTQHSVGFVLPLIQPGQGYGQFVNQNHFAFLMEMGFGLTLGMILGGGVRREQGADLLRSATANLDRAGLVELAWRFAGDAGPGNRCGAAVSCRCSGANQTAVGLKALRVVRLWPVRVFFLVLLLLGVVGGTLWIGGDRLVSRFEHGEWRT